MQTMNAMQPRYEVSDADKLRRQCIADAWNAYHNDVEPPLRKMDDQPDDNVLTNRIAGIVNTGKDWLFGKPVDVRCAEGSPEDAQIYLDSVWGKNEKRLPLLQDAAMNGAFAGRAFLRIVPNKRGNKFRLVAIDPAIVCVETAPQDCEVVLCYCIEYAQEEQIEGRDRDVYYHEEITRIDPDGEAAQGMPDDDDTWQVSHWTKIGEKGAWVPVGEPYIWPYPFAPIFSCKNLPLPNSFWGLPDVTRSLIGLNAAIQLANSNISRNIKIYGQPLMTATGVGEGVVDIKPGVVNGLPGVDSKVEAVAITCDIPSALMFAAELRSDQDEESGVPAVALGRMKDLIKGQVSGVTMELMFMPMTQKTETKRCSYGGLIIDVSQALLVLNGFSPDIEVSLSWQDALPKDDLASVQAALAKSQLGISKYTLIAEEGYDPDEEAERNLAEQSQQVIDYSRGVGLPPMDQMPQGQEQMNGGQMQ